MASTRSTVRWEAKETVGTAGKTLRGDADAAPTAVGPYETFVADPPDLPVRQPGEDGVAVVGRAEVVATTQPTFKAALSDGGSRRSGSRPPATA